MYISAAIHDIAITEVISGSGYITTTESASNMIKNSSSEHTMTTLTGPAVTTQAITRPTIITQNPTGPVVIAQNPTELQSTDMDQSATSISNTESATKFTTAEAHNSQLIATVAGVVPAVLVAFISLFVMIMLILVRR